jgi:hypothetical protein
MLKDKIEKNQLKKTKNKKSVRANLLNLQLRSQDMDNFIYIKNYRASFPTKPMSKAENREK